MGEIREGARLFPRSVLTCRRIVGDSDMSPVLEGRGLRSGGWTGLSGSGLAAGFAVGPGSEVVKCMADIADGGLMAPELPCLYGWLGGKLSGFGLSS